MSARVGASDPTSAAKNAAEMGHPAPGFVVVPTEKKTGPSTPLPHPVTRKARVSGSPVAPLRMTKISGLCCLLGRLGEGSLALGEFC